MFRGRKFGMGFADIVPLEVALCNRLHEAIGYFTAHGSVIKAFAEDFSDNAVKRIGAEVA
jgi:hypothetical protein